MSGGQVHCAPQFPNGCGTVFSLTPPSMTGAAWTEAVLYAFQGMPDGIRPFTGVMPGANGTLLGTTISGGSPQCTYGCGTLFQLTPPAAPGENWTEQIL